jgi:hypothetical protein
MFANVSHHLSMNTRTVLVTADAGNSCSTCGGCWQPWRHHHTINVSRACQHSSIQQLLTQKPGTACRTLLASSSACSSTRVQTSCASITHLFV